MTTLTWTGETDWNSPKSRTRTVAEDGPTGVGAGTVTMGFQTGDIPQTGALVSWWPLFDASGPFTDVVSSHNATLQNSPNLQGGTAWYGRSPVELVQTDDEHATASDHSDFDVAEHGNMSIFAWVYHSDVSSGDPDRHILTKRQSTSPYCNWAFRTNVDGGEDNLQFYRNNSGNWSTVQSNTVGWTTGEWHAVAVTYDEASNDVDFYLDGADQGTRSLYSLGNTNNAPVSLGMKAYDIIEQSWWGSLAHVMFWNGATLTQSEVQQLTEFTSASITTGAKTS